MHFHEDELEFALDPLYLERGRRYQAQGRVLSVEPQKNGTLVAALVRGSGSRVYKLLIRLARTAKGSLDVTGQCSCPVHYNCKHVAAALLELAVSGGGNGGSGLPRELGIWLDRLRKADRSVPPRTLQEALLYLVQLDANYTGRFLMVHATKVRRLKNGGYSGAERFAAGTTSLARFLEPLDRQILGLLETGRNRFAGSYELRGRAGSQALELMLDTGRCRWDAPEGLLLRPGEPLESSLDWGLDADGSQSVRAASASPGCLLLPLAPPWYLNPQDGRCGPVATGLPDSVAETLAGAPPVTLDQAAALTRALEASFPDRGLPKPQEVNTRRREDVPPVPCLLLRSERDEVYFPHERDAWEDWAELWFDYAGVRVHPLDEEPTLVHRRGETLEPILRHSAAEIAGFETLVDLGFRPDQYLPDDDVLPLIHREGQEGWLDFVLQHLPALREQGWRIEMAEGFRYQMVEPDQWYAVLDEPSRQEWFNLELGVEVEGEQVNLLPILAGYLRRLRGAADIGALREQPDDTPLLCPMEDGRMLRLPVGRARQVIDVLTELYDPLALDRDGKLKMSRLQTPQLADLEQRVDQLRWDGGAALREQGERLRAFSGIQPVQPPAGLKAQLRPYQQTGLYWLQFLREYDLAGILADDMGLGKTIQTLAHLLLEKTEGRADRPSLVVAPTSLMLNWRREAERFAPELRVLTLQGPQRQQHFEHIAEQDLVLTTYPLLPRDADYLLAQPYHLLILDEAQHIKNPRSKAAESVRRLQARHRLCLTGTPLENHLGELWAQFHFLLPGLLGDEKRFRKLFRTPIEKQADEPRRQALQRRIAPFLLRREKGEVLEELPPKSEILNEVELAGAQRDLYESIRVAMHERVRREIDRKGIQRSQMIILDALLKLRQVCCDPRLLKLEAARPVKQSAKLELLVEMLPDLVEDGRRILLFSQFTTMLGLIEERLKGLNIDHVKLTGQTRDRATPIDRFQSGAVPVFLISLKAGGSGLNLTAADTVIHYDPWWNPAVERQATDRAHRIGQDKPVFVYKLLTRGTVEEKIVALQARKQELADALFGGKAGSGALTPEDLQALFEPIG
jgi:superfamily II DNA or RNA helicase